MSTQLQSEYDRWHEQRAYVGDDDATNPWHLATLRHLPDVEGKRVLEIGCGRGVFAAELARRGADVVAADFSETALNYTRERLQGTGATVLADVQAMPFPDESFDVVVSQETLEHVPHPEQGLAELVRVTGRGGTLILTGPNYLNAVGLYRVFLALVGRRYTEEGQPLNQPLILASQVRKLRRLGCHIRVVEGDGVPYPRGPHQWGLLPSRPQRLLCWLAINTVIVATRRELGGELKSGVSDPVDPPPGAGTPSF
jgi:2-polyprenyl-3-methyl-5-hydroxy-6-metoxy-1,4-benzoquinol methylase